MNMSNLSGYDWVYCHNFSIPANAVKCGKDMDGSDIFVGSSYHRGDELPCKIVPRRREAYVCYDGREIKVTEFRVLCQKTMQWITSSNGQVPYGAVPAGRTSSGETLYVGRARMRGATVMGKIHPSHGCLYVPFGGKEVAHKQYEVLVLI